MSIEVPADIAALLRAEPRTVMSADGRGIAVGDLGDPRGRPVFWLHGAPSCRLEAVLAVPWARRSGVRLLSLDRPGVGRSDPAIVGAVDTTLAWADDVERVAAELGLDRFSVFGGSGGGPYALACAHRFAERLDAVVVTAPGGVYDGAREVAGLIDRAADVLAVRAGWLLGLYFRAMATVGSLPAPLLRLFASGPEGQMLRAALDAGLVRAMLTEAFRQGPAGAVDDFRRLGRFGFRLEDISVPVLFVHGSRDPFVPARQTETFAARTPGGELLLLEGLGHGGAIFALDRITDALR